MNKTKWIVVRQVLRITLIYLSLSIIYILFSDEITNRLLTDPHHIAHVQTYKGLAFIFITSLIIFFLVYHFMLQQAKALNKERESREYFKKVFDNAGTGIAITAWDETFEQCNQVFCQILGYQHEEFSELKLSNLIYSPDKKSFSKLLIQVKEGGSSFCQLETRFMHKSSTVVWVQLYLTTLPNENEESEHLLLLISDVTERKQIEEERKIQNFYLKKAQELGSIGTWHLDIKNNRLTWTEENYKIFGIPRTQVLSYQVFLGAIHPEDRTYVDKKWKEAMEGAPYDLEHRIQVHGKTRWVREKGVVEFDELNKPVGAIGVVQDITQKKQHEAELKAQKDEYYSLFEEYRVINEDLLITKELAEANEKQFRLLADNAPQAIFIQLGSHFAYVNQAAVELYGAKSKEDLLGTLIIDRIEDSYKEIVKERIRQLNENKIKVAVNEYQHLTLDGNSVDVSVSAVPFTYNNSDGALVFVQNISDRKAAEQKLTESERMLKLFVKHAPAAIAMFDTEMRYLAVSDRYLRDYKLKGNSLVGHSHYEVFPEIDDEWKKLHKKALNGSVEKRDEDPFKRADGSLDWIRWELRPWFTSGNTIGGIILFSEVITERRNSELKAKEQQLLFETMFNAISDGIVITDTDRNIKLANKGMFNTFGYLPGELVGKSTRMLYADDQVFADTGEAVFKKEATSPENLYLTYYKNKWSQVFPGETFGTKLYDNSGTWIGNLGIMRNISERVNYIEALKQRNAELLTAEEEIRAHNEQLYDTVEKLHKSELELMKSSFFFEQLYMQSAISTQLLDNEGWCVRINPKLSELFGVAPESIEGRKYNIFNDREIIEKGIIAYLKRVFEYKEQVSWEVAFDISNASESTGVKVSKGGKKWFFCKAYPILDESENLVNVIIQHIDIDARKQAETELNKSEKQLQHIFDNSPAIMFLLNNDMEIVRFNKTSTEFSGIDPKKIMQSRQGYLLNCINSLNEPHKCGQTDNCANCSLHKTVQQSIKNHETMMKVKTEMNLVKNGQRAHFTFLVSSSIVIFDKELLYLVTLEDITELKKMEQALLNTVIQTEESERKRIAQDLHDGIGPLLSTVKLYAQTYINSKNRELKNTIKEQFLSTLNDAINQVSLISNNLSPHVLNDFGLNAAIQRIIDKTQFVYPITFDYSFLLKNELKPEYNITLYRLVLELINNTLKHAQASLIKIHIEERNQILYLDFMNNGKIFNFEKSKNAGKGMGLFNIISRIQSLGGKVTFNAGKEQGVTYLMEIPL